MEARHFAPVGSDSNAPTLYSVGHGSRSAEQFSELLCAAAIEWVVDVRSYPVSRRHPRFSQPALTALLEKAGIGYHWMGKALGGFRQGSSQSIHSALTTDGLRAYAEHMGSGEFQAGVAELLDCVGLRPTAMLCAERLPHHCHRAMISDYLTANGIAVVHLVAEDQRILHRFSHLARWAQGRIIYDQGGHEQLGWEF